MQSETRKKPLFNVKHIYRGIPHDIFQIQVIFYDRYIALCSVLINERLPRVNFINILRAYFLYKILAPKISNPKHTFVIFGAKILYKKCACRMFKKLTPFYVSSFFIYATFSVLNLIKFLILGAYLGGLSY